MTFKELMKEYAGYDVQTTFWEDFSIADRLGIPAVKATYDRAFNGWKSNHIFLTELVMVLNHKIWQYYEKNSDIADLYNSLWEKADQYALENLKGDELNYFIRVTD